MEVQYVREFLTLVKYGNYLAAADELFISQSTLSKHIFALEKELGLSLLNRTTRKVQLNQYGAAFLPYAQKMVEADSDFRNKLADMKSTTRDSIRLGVLPAFLAYHTEDAVIEFRRKFPQFPISLVEGSNTVLMSNLKEGICNLALVRSFDKPLPSELVAAPLIRDQVTLIVLPGSLFDDGRTSLRWEELDQVELLTSTSSQQAAALAAFSQKFGCHLNIISRLSRTPSILEMLRKGIGNAALLQRTVSKYYQRHENFRILDLEPPLYSTVSLVYRENTPLTPAMRAFIDTVSVYLKERN